MILGLSIALFLGAVAMIVCGSLAIAWDGLGSLTKTWGIVVLVIGILLLIGGGIPFIW
jgi:ABC-type nickel/cobalt efflux system permease component RcnA